MNLGVIQARMGSSRLPGKMMLPLADEHVITHIVHRVAAARLIDNIVVATSRHDSDDIIERYAERAGAAVHRGSEEDVLGRMYEAAADHDPDVVVRIAGDRPLLPPECIDHVIRAVTESGADYATNTIERSFPRGFEAEAFTMDSFVEIERRSTKAHEREHVTPYFRTNPDSFERVDVGSDEVFDDQTFHDRTDLRLTLDVADDYELLRSIYENVPFDTILPARDAIRYVDDHGLASMNAHVTQRGFTHASSGNDG